MKKIVIIFALFLVCFSSAMANNHSPKKVVTKKLTSCTRSFSAWGKTATVTSLSGDCNAAFIMAVKLCQM